MIHKLQQARFLPDIGGLFALVTFILLTIFSGGRSLIDGDTYWHIAAGQRMLASRTILTQDVFSHTAVGAPWTAHEWLAEIVMAMVHAVSGLPGVCIFFFLIASMSYWLLYIITRQKASEWFSLGFVALAFVFSLTHLLARPHIFTWLLGGLTFFILQKQNKSLYFLPFLTTLWSNLHGGFILGIVLQLMFLVSNLMDANMPFNAESFKFFAKNQKTPLLVLFFSVVAVGINPFGFSLYLFPFQVSAEIFSQGIDEWLSPNMQKEWLFRFLLLFILFLLTQPTVQTTWRERFFLLFFINAALVHQRHISIAGYFLAPFLAKTTQEWLTTNFVFFEKLNKSSDENSLKLSRCTGPIGMLFLSAILLLLTSQPFPKTRLFFSNLIPIPEKRFPLGAFGYLLKNRPSGTLFNEYSWGGFSIYFLGPEMPVFIDGRADMYGERIFGDYIKVVSLHRDFLEILNNYKVDLVLYRTDSPLIRYLKATSDWSEVYADKLATILKKANK